jgi:hypothetical protein
LLDENLVNSFLRHADEIFHTAQEGTGDCEMAILVHRDGSIHVVPDTGWATETLRQYHGAATVYRVSRKGPQVRVEARSDAERCELRTDGPPRFAAFREMPQYLLVA